MHILLIEDDTALCAALAPALAGLGKADFCHTGPEGLSLLVSGGYDLCILDRLLPGLDGLTLLRAARAQGVTTPVLLLTPWPAPGTRWTGWTRGRTIIWPNPLTPPFCWPGCGLCCGAAAVPPP